MRIRISMLLVAIVFATFAGLLQTSSVEAQETPMIGDTGVSVDLVHPIEVRNNEARFAPGQTTASLKAANARVSCGFWTRNSNGYYVRGCKCTGSGCWTSWWIEVRSFNPW